MTICVDSHSKTIPEYEDLLNVSSEAMKISEQMHDSSLRTESLGELRFSALDWAKAVALLNRKSIRKVPHDENQLDEYLNPTASMSWNRLRLMQKIFVQNVDKRLHDKMSYSLRDILVSCTFDNTHNCLEESRFDVRDDCLSCFTFNKNGKEEVPGNEAGLDVILYLNK